MNYHFEKTDTTKLKHTMAAAYAGVWSIESRAMLPLSRDRLRNFPLSIFLFDDNKYTPPLGHIGISQVEQGQAVVGGFVVDPNHRGEGLGYTMLKNLLSTVDAEIPGIETCTSNVNTETVELFVRAGGVVAGSRTPLAITGCNTIIDLSSAIERNGQGVQA